MELRVSPSEGMVRQALGGESETALAADARRGVFEPWHGTRERVPEQHHTT